MIDDSDALRKTGSLDGTSMQIVAQAYYLSGDKQGCEKYIKSNFASPGDTTLELLMRCAYDAGDDATQRGRWKPWSPIPASRNIGPTCSSCRNTPPACAITTRSTSIASSS